MKMPSYTSTPGLDRYPEQERFAVYRATHRRLMREDGAYQRRWSAYVAGIVCTSVVPFAGFWGAPGLLFSGLCVMAGVCAVVYLAFRQQEFMNRRIGDVLEKSMA
jgi:multisubunit Na+/H+ antiporter MnhB subunit